MSWSITFAGLVACLAVQAAAGSASGFSNGFQGVANGDQHVLKPGSLNGSIPLDAVGQDSHESLRCASYHTNLLIGLEHFTHPAFADYRLRITEPKLCDPSVKQYSGYLDISETRHLFFW